MAPVDMRISTTKHIRFRPSRKMYTPSAYRTDDPVKLGRAIDAFPFAALARNGPAGPVFAYAPLAREVVDGETAALVGHLARTNPFWRDASGEHVAALFSGPHGYISPSHYPSKAEHGKAVPTWNYLRIEARGTLSVETDPAKIRQYFDMPTGMMEQYQDKPWSADDAPGDYIQKLAHAIVGIKIRVSSIEGSWKLGQTHSAADRQGAIEGLRREGNIALAEKMEGE